MGEPRTTGDDRSAHTLMAVGFDRNDRTGMFAMPPQRSVTQSSASKGGEDA